MPSSPRTTPPSAIQSSPADPPPIERTKAGLLTLLDTVDVEGWNGPAATALLTYLRTDLIRPLAIDVGLRGAAASQAEATAWEAVWLQLCAPSLRPWRRSERCCTYETPVRRPATTSASCSTAASTSSTARSRTFRRSARTSPSCETPPPHLTRGPATRPTSVGTSEPRPPSARIGSRPGGGREP